MYIFDVYIMSHKEYIHVYIMNQMYHTNFIHAYYFKFLKTLINKVILNADLNSNNKH